MKKLLSFFLAILLVLPLLSACNDTDKVEPPAINYTTNILINQEAPSHDLVWYSYLRAPTSGGLIDLPNYSSYAILDASEISLIPKRDYQNILDAKASFRYTFFEKVSFFFNRSSESKKRNYKLKLLDMTSRELDQKIGKYFDPNRFNYYQDRVFGVIYPTIYQGETEETTGAEYANKNILVDYDYDTSVVITYTDEELKAASNGICSASYTGRIGDRYYLTYGYYDLTARKLCPYKDESDLPPYKDSLGIEDQYDLLRLIKKDPVAAAYVPDHHYIYACVRIKDRYYAVINAGNRYYSNSIDDYEGENVFLVSVDAVTGKVLYLQKYHLENYWGYEYKLCSLGEDGILYDVMAE